MLQIFHLGSGNNYICHNLNSQGGDGQIIEYMEEHLIKYESYYRNASYQYKRNRLSFYNCTIAIEHTGVSFIFIINT